jgi:hypothetical protein
MIWIILIAGIIALLFGIYLTSSMHDELRQQGHHWSNALEIGQRAGNIVGLGVGLIMAAMFLYAASLI